LKVEDETLADAKKNKSATTLAAVNLKLVEVLTTNANRGLTFAK
jgi:hypothetical protein